LPRSKPSTASAIATASPEAPGAAPVGRRRRRRGPSALTRRILTLNILALAIPVAGLLYLDDYREQLVEQEFHSLEIEGQLFAGAVATSGVVTDQDGDDNLSAETAREVVRRLAAISFNRARLFGIDGALLVDSARLLGPSGAASGTIEIAPLAPPGAANPLAETARRLYDRIADLLATRQRPPLYIETANPRATDYAEIGRAFAGEIARGLRADTRGGMMLTVAVPVQRYRQVLGALLLSSDGRDIDVAVRDIRFAILGIFGIALAVTVLLSLYLAGTIARPILRLAVAADRVRHGQRRRTAIPDFGHRRDEIGDLAGALRDMTEELWNRMDAIESFAADVAHEIKNPLTSLRSAVETVARVEDPAQQRKLMDIIQHDVQRLDRLISDISNASRLDAELSRAELAPVDMGQMLRALAEMHAATAGPKAPRLTLDIASHQDLTVPGIEGRLAQVFRNLIANAASFSPPGGDIRLSAVRDGAQVRIAVSDEGPGIPDDKLEAIFARFYTERPAGESFGDHSGLGLSISRQIVEAHGGTLKAENRRDASGAVRGACFRVVLPVG